MREEYIDGVLRERWNDTTSTYTAWNAAGVQLEQRAYTAAETAEGQARTAARAQGANAATINTNLLSDLTVLAAILAQTNADLRTDPSQEIKDIAQVLRRLIRAELKRFEAAN